MERILIPLPPMFHLLRHLRLSSRNVRFQGPICDPSNRFDASCYIRTGKYVSYRDLQLG